MSTIPCKHPKQPILFGHLTLMRLSIVYKDSPPSGHFWFVLTKMHLIIFFNVVATICHVTLVWAFMAQASKAQMGGSKLVIEYIFINPFPLYFFHPKAWTKWPCTKLHYDINSNPPTHAFTHIFNGFRHLLYFLVTFDQNEYWCVGMGVDFSMSMISTWPTSHLIIAK